MLPQIKRFLKTLIVVGSAATFWASQPPAKAWDGISAAAAIPVSTAAVQSHPLVSGEIQPIQDAVDILPSLGEPETFLPREVYSDNTRLVLKLKERRVYFYRNNQLEASYQVAIGRKGWETPTGTFQVIQMMHDPIWQHPFTGEMVPPGPDNPLGARWIGFWTDGNNFIGFHGTPNEELIGKAVSHGCVRMRNQDISALFDQVAVGTAVVVEP